MGSALTFVVPSWVVANASKAAAAAPRLQPPSCLDSSGRPVDGWSVLKVPDSFAYYSYDATASNSWVKSSTTLDQSTAGNVMLTAAQAYSKSYFSVLYNDEMGSGSLVYAHAKGILVTDGQNQGFWLTHSVPKWPAASRGPGPLPDNKYGQSMMCITVNAKTINTISAALRVDRVLIYNTNTPSGASASSLPDFAALLSGKLPLATSDTSVTAITSLAGKSYAVFAKSAKWDKDLYGDLIGPYFKAALQVETWRNGVGTPMGSLAAGKRGNSNLPYAIYEINTVSMPDGTTWKGTSDHSKWCAAKGTSSSGSRVTCFGDLNRMCSQEVRGGGALCQTDSRMWQAMSTIVGTLQPVVAPSDVCKGRASCYWCKASLEEKEAEAMAGAAVATH